MNLNGKWLLTGPDESGLPLSLPAAVPGCVHTDFLRAGIIKNIYYRDNSKKIQWIENNDYNFTKVFTVETLESNAFLEFDGLDTYATVLLNGTVIGECDDMHVPYAFPADGILRAGENTVEVRFRSPIKEVAGRPDMKGAFTHERMHTRRIQCTYSWDWVDRFVTMGIYRDVRLVFRKTNEIDDFYLVTKDINPYAAQLKLDVAIRDFVSCGDELAITILAPDGKPVFNKKRTLIQRKLHEYIDVASPELWYPNGYGQQPLYTLILACKESRKEFKFGIRQITILQLEDAPGSPAWEKSKIIQQSPSAKISDYNESYACFTVLVNGVKVFCQGGDWVPCEPFPSEESPEKITRLLELSVQAGVNMVRVWGGGIFERDEFYNECDRLGILVTQDFLMACGTYPETETWFIKALTHEAEAAALRLRNHTCLAWWSGDNENAVRGSENRTDFPGYRSATYGIEPILSVLDPERYFLPSSPYGGDCYSSSTRGTTHNTFYLWPTMMHARDTDFADYRDFFNSQLARFNAEQAAIGMPFVSTLKKFLTEEDIFGDDTSMSEYHTKNNPSFKSPTLYGYIEMMTQKIFGAFENGPDRIRKMQMFHCEWVRLSFELFRRNQWYSSGILYWMLNDCWPAAAGWSLIDYYGNPKPAYYLFKRCARPVIASFEKDGDTYRLFVSNNALHPVRCSGRLYTLDAVTGQETLISNFPFTMAAGSAGAVASVELPKDAISETMLLLADVTSDENSDRAFFVFGRYMDLPLTYVDPEIVEETEDAITVRARELTPFVLLDVPALLEENCFFLKKNEYKTIKKICGGNQ